MFCYSFQAAVVVDHVKMEALATIRMDTYSIVVFAILDGLGRIAQKVRDLSLDGYHEAQTPFSPTYFRIQSTPYDH